MSPEATNQRAREQDQLVAWLRASLNAPKLEPEAVRQAPLKASMAMIAKQLGVAVGFARSPALGGRLHKRDVVPLERDRVLTHSDAHPPSRTTPSGKPWDTVEAQSSWERFEAELAAT